MLNYLLMPVMLDSGMSTAELLHRPLITCDQRRLQKSILTMSELIAKCCRDAAHSLSMGATVGFFLVLLVLPLKRMRSFSNHLSSTQC